MFHAGRVDVPYQNAKAVAMQMAGSQLVDVATHLQDANTVSFELWQPFLEIAGDRYHLPADGVPILEARAADIAHGNAQSLGDLSDEKLGAHAPFFHPEIQKVAASRWLIGRYLFDLEILGNDLNAPADAR